MKKRKIGIFTGNRAEYGLQAPIIDAVNKHPDLEYQLIVSGAHLDKEFGATLHEIEADGFQISAKVTLDVTNDSLLSTAQNIGLGICEISRVINDLKPDLMIVYADRYEGFAAVIAASQLGIPVVHIEGGDVTEGGALDDTVRHAMTKLSHLHFTTNEDAKKRVLDLGEEEWRVFNCGLPALDFLRQDRFACPEQVCEALELELTSPIIVFTQHSVTTEYDKAKQQLAPSLDALRELATENVQVIITYPNNDAGGRAIINSIEEFSKELRKNVKIAKSLGRHLYHGLLSLSLNENVRIACVGNSSSGIKETPAFLCPTVNIGSRQEGRLRGTNVLDVNYDQKQIYNAIKTCLFDDSFRINCRKCENPYGNGNAGNIIASELASVALDQSLLRKKITF